MKIFTQDVAKKVIVTITMLAIGALLSAVTLIYQGANDGTKALNMSEQNKHEIDSLCFKFGVMEIRIVHIYQNMDETNQRLEKIDNKIDKIYEILITK